MTDIPETACGHGMPAHHVNHVRAGTGSYWHDGDAFYCSAECMGAALQAADPFTYVSRESCAGQQDLTLPFSVRVF